MNKQILPCIRFLKNQEYAHPNCCTNIYWHTLYCIYYRNGFKAKLPATLEKNKVFFWTMDFCKLLEALCIEKTRTIIKLLNLRRESNKSS